MRSPPLPWERVAQRAGCGVAIHKSFPWMKGRTLAARLSIREECLIAKNLIFTNFRLTFWRYHPIYKHLTEGRFDVRVFLVVDQDDAVLVEQNGVAFDENFQVALVLKL